MPATADKEYPHDIVRGTFFEHDVPIKQMFVHFRTQPGGYARPLRQHRLNKLMAEWDRQAVGVLLLSMRNDGRMAIIDGQHRKEAAAMVGVDKLDALVFIDLSLEDEARLYRKFGDYLKQTALDRYHAGVAEKVPEYLAIQRIVGQHGMQIPNVLYGGPNIIAAVDALVSVAKQYGLDALDSTLGLLHDAWQGEHAAYRHPQILGTAMFLARFQGKPNLNTKRLSSRLAKEGVSLVERKAGSFREVNLAANTSAAWGQALLYFHDQRIPESRQLGDWPKKFSSEATKEARAQNIREINANKSAETRHRQTVKANATLSVNGRAERARNAVRSRYGYTPHDVPCSYCYAAAGQPCHNDLNQPVVRYHEIRRATARERANDSTP